MKVLHEIIDQVSERRPSNVMGITQSGIATSGGTAVGRGAIYDDDDDDEGPKFKEILGEYIVKVTNYLCIWDCCWLWIKVSEILAFLVFDPFTELFITLAIAVNVAFMTLDHYESTPEYDGM